DINVHGTDLVIATHGRAFWIMDDVTPLRQLGEAAATGTYLFAPATAYRLRPANQEGTPLPVDEPQADNAPVGLYIDYYLADVPHTPVVLDVLESNGSVVRHWSSANPPKPVDPKSISFLPRWLTPHPVPVAEAGAHRFVWDLHEKSHDGPMLPPGYYTIRLSVNGRTYERTARILRDPRIAASDADLHAQYDFAQQVIALRAEVGALRTKAEAIAKGLSGERASAFRRDVVGAEPPENPDDSMGVYSHDVSSFLFLEGQLDNLISAVESADAAPTPTMRAAYAKLAAIYRRTRSAAGI
ncbi:MAG TPA: hypothetical protein VKE42_01250, partial [Candidatus Cybelea sp.]|nr:hypothetical protein [Candidatus Cybelea sp.]